MTVISSKEFVSNQKKYFDMAVNESVFIRRGRNKFMVSNVNQNEEFLEPDDDFRRAISAKELVKMLHEDIHQMFNEKK